MDELLEVLKSAYEARVQKRMNLDKQKIDALAEIAMGESALGILRKLKKLDQS